jgi:hypothetical protein
MKAIYTLVVLFLTTLSYAQEVTRKIDSYTSLIVSRGVDVRLVKSSSNEVKITTNGIDPNELITESRGDELVIKVATKSLWQEMQDNHWWARVELPYKTIENLEISTGAKVSSKETFTGGLLDVQVSMGGEMELDVQVERLIIESSMGAMAEASGSAKKVELSASMGAEIDLRELTAENVQAKASMGSDVRVHATKEFDGRANMGGTIRVTGNPDKFYQSTSMGGDISGKN